MTYQLKYTNRAKNDLIAATDYIAKQVPQTAEAWFDGFVETLAKTQSNPNIYGLAPESDLVDEEDRQVIYRSKSRRMNRALFVVRSKTIYILCIRRPGQEVLSITEARGLLSF